MLLLLFDYFLVSNICIVARCLFTNEGKVTIIVILVSFNVLVPNMCILC